MGSKSDDVKYRAATTRVPGVGPIPRAEHEYVAEVVSKSAPFPMARVAGLIGEPFKEWKFFLDAHRDVLRRYVGRITDDGKDDDDDEASLFAALQSTAHSSVFAFENSLIHVDPMSNGDGLQVVLVYRQAELAACVVPPAAEATRKLCRLSFLVQDFAKAHIIVQPSKVKCFIPDGSYWVANASRNLRAIDSLFGLDHMIKSIITDIEDFYKLLPKFERLGATPKRTILLSGPPGCGKSSLLRAVASHFKQSLYFVSKLDARESYVSRLFNAVPSGAFLVFEDIDRNGAGATPDSTLLSVLDGNFCTHPRIYFLTTNFPETLDAAVRRPGRVDREYRFGSATADQARAALQFAFAEEKPSEILINAAVDKFAEVKEPITMSYVMEAIIRTLGCATTEESLNVIDFQQVVTEKKQEADAKAAKLAAHAAAKEARIALSKAAASKRKRNIDDDADDDFAHDDDCGCGNDD